METFKTDMENVEFFTVHGRVIDSNKVSETHVSSSGGDVWTDANGNTHSTPLSVSSRSVTNHDFWIMTDDGEERNVKLIDHDVPLRIGQRITMLYASREGTNTGSPAALINHTAGNHWLLNKAGALNQDIGFYPVSSLMLFLLKPMTIAISIVFGGWIAMLLGPLGIFLIMGIVIHLWSVWKFASRINKVVDGLDAHIGDLCQSIYQTHGDNPEVSENQGQITEAS